MTITRSKGKTHAGTPAPGGDSFIIGGNLTPKKDVELDPDFDTVDFELDGAWRLRFKIVEAQRLNTVGVIKWKGVNKMDDDSNCEVEIDLIKGSWRVSAAAADLSDVSPGDGLLVKLRAGPYEGSALINPVVRSTIRLKE